MAPVSDPPSAGTSSYPRVIGALRGSLPGPTVIILGGIHGNEPAGIHAARRVLAEIAESAIAIRGEFLALAGNLPALARNERHLGTDLNRMWTDAQVRELKTRGAVSQEEHDQEELLAALEAAIARATDTVYFLDLHSTSADGIPFAIGSNGSDQGDFAARFPLPVIRGLHGQLVGVLLEYLARRGCITLGVEGGRHDDPASIDNHHATIWTALASVGVVSRDAHPAIAGGRRRLLDQVHDLPAILRVVSRYAITPEDEFKMKPGYRNIHRVPRGEVVARDRRGDIKVPVDGYLVMPLYQGVGDDGFFFALPSEG